jgi:hypothetical protein
MGYQSILVNQKTSLKQEVKKGKYLASEYDNICFTTPPKSIEIDKGVKFLLQEFRFLKRARMISDHIPIWFEFSLN